MGFAAASSDDLTTTVRTKVWSDRDYTFTSVPDEIRGAKLFQGPHKSISSGTTITITVSGNATLYLSFEAERPSGSPRDGGFPNSLPDAGWSNTGQVLTWDIEDMQVWSKSVEAGTVRLPSTATSSTVMSIGIREGISSTALVGQILAEANQIITPAPSERAGE